MNRMQARLMTNFCISFGAWLKHAPRRKLYQPDDLGRFVFYVPTPDIPLEHHDKIYPPDQVPTKSENTLDLLRAMEDQEMLMLFDEREPGSTGGDDDIVIPGDPTAPISFILEDWVFSWYRAQLARVEAQ